MEVLDEASITLGELTENPALLRTNGRVTQWISDELKGSLELRQYLESRKKGLDFTSRTYIRFLMKGIDMGMKRAQDIWLS